MIPLSRPAALTSNLVGLVIGAHVTASDDTMEHDSTRKEEQRLEGRKRRRLSLSADRCENQGAE